MSRAGRQAGRQAGSLWRNEVLISVYIGERSRSIEAHRCDAEALDDSDRPFLGEVHPMIIQPFE